jgi:hypothetical protein
MQSWNIINGKLLSSHQLENFPYLDYTDFTNDKTERQEFALLKSKAPLEDVVKYDYFERWQTATSNTNQHPYLDGEEVAVHNWRYIEIVGEREIREHLNFNHYTLGVQELYINKNYDKLIQKLKFGKTYIYEIEGKESSLNKLRMIQRLTNYPDEMEIDDNILQCYSPDFSQTLFLDKKNKSFEIHDTISDNLIVKIPTDIMSFKKLDEV